MSGIKKKGIFFTLDAILGASLLIFGIVLMSMYFVRQVPSEQSKYYSQDSVDFMADTKVNGLELDYVMWLVNQSNSTDINVSILEQIGIFYVKNETALARNLSREVFESLIPDRFGFNILVDGSEILIRNATTSRKEMIYSSKRMISGIEYGRPITGTTARVFLSGIAGKMDSKFAYFGGFVGQGNLTRFITGIPEDANITRIMLEADIASNFSLYINNVFCNNYTVALRGNMTASIFNLTECHDSIEKKTEAKNNFTLIFSEEDIGNAYVGGGFIQTVYKTEQMSETVENATTFWFPDVKGIVNVYSSFYVPGNISNMEIFIHYFANHTNTSNETFYLTIGNNTMLIDTNSTTEQQITITNSELNATLDYASMQEKTIPIRVGFQNVSYQTTFTGISDVFLVSDVSGSMEFCSNSTGWSESGWVYNMQKGCYRWYSWWYYQFYNSVSDSGYMEFNRTLWNNGPDDYCSCRWHARCPAGVETNLEIYRRAALNFTNEVLEYPGNNMGIVEFTNHWPYVYENACTLGANMVTPFPDSVVRSISLTNNESAVLEDINATETYWGTKTCAGILNATDKLGIESNLTRKQSIVVMSDGQANEHCSDILGHTVPNYDGDGSTYDDPQDHAIHAATLACNQNITVYTVGFSEDADEKTLMLMACNSSLYYNATNTSKLVEAFTEIAQQLLVAGLVAQKVEVEGSYRSSDLYGDSYIMINYTPSISPYEFGEISLTKQSDKFSTCSETISMPGGVRITESSVTSYSSDHWTSALTVNNNEVYNLTDYGAEYSSLGDPYLVSFSPGNLLSGFNTINIQTADGPGNFTGCSRNNSLIYKAMITPELTYSEVYESADGCTWTIENEDLSISSFTIPNSYSGSNACNYTSSSIEYDNTDIYDLVIEELLDRIDLDNDGRIDINLEANEIQINLVSIGQIPYLWGPTLVEMRVWQ